LASSPIGAIVLHDDSRKAALSTISGRVNRGEPLIRYHLD